MIQGFKEFAKQLLVSGGFRITEFPRKAYRDLLTGLGQLREDEVRIIPGMIELANAHPGYLVIDDTKNPKYGLSHWAKKLKILTNGATRSGYEVVLLLWLVPGLGRFPIGFALSHKGTDTPAELALQGMSLLRNRHDLRPEAVLADGAFSTDDTLKRLTDYGWVFVMRSRNTRTVNGTQVKRLIPRGYGETEGFLKNGVKLKVIRDRKHFLFCNRMLLERQAIQALYHLRWKIEEVFRVLKSGIGLDGCQQHREASPRGTPCGRRVFLCLRAFCYFRIWRSFQTVNLTQPWQVSFLATSNLKT